MILQGAVSYQIELGNDIYGNITRINNALGKMEDQLHFHETKLTNLQQQMDAAKAEINKPFQYDVTFPYGSGNSSSAVVIPTYKLLLSE